MANTHTSNGELRETLRNKCVNFIAFDGTHWLSAAMALPSAVLDPEKYLPNKYSYEHVSESERLGRECFFLHGFESETRLFPEHLPVVDAKRFSKNHENNIIPLWNQHLENADHNIPKTVTQFEHVKDESSLSRHLPCDAISALQDAHTNNKPIAIQYDPLNLKWAEIPGFEDLVRKNKLLFSKPSNQVRPPSQSWIDKIKHVDSKRIAIIGATVAIGAIGAYWLIARQKPSEKTQGKNVNDISQSF